MESTVVVIEENTELITYFKSVNLPTEPFQLSECERIRDADNFVTTNLMRMRVGGPFADSCRLRLQRLRIYLEANPASTVLIAQPDE